MNDATEPSIGQGISCPWLLESRRLLDLLAEAPSSRSSAGDRRETCSAYWTVPIRPWVDSTESPCSFPIPITSSTATSARRRCSPRRSRAPSPRSPISCSSSTTSRPGSRSRTSRRPPTTSLPSTWVCRAWRRAFPISLRLLRQVHAELLRGTRGGETGPGEFRRIQNWLGGQAPEAARYVPPPPKRCQARWQSLEKFLHGDPCAVPLLIRAALAHAQFETIHPFLDGNGRVGRLLVTLLLCSDTADGEERVPLAAAALPESPPEAPPRHLLRTAPGDPDRWRLGGLAPFLSRRE